MPRAKKSAPKKRKPTTKARRAASRKNGVKGGRPRDRMPAASLDELDKLPRTTAKEIQLWNASVLVEIQRLNMRGEISNELATSLRAGAKAIDAALPPKPSRDDDDEDDDDEDDDDEQGPPLTPASNAGLRVG
jgi:hypothetical protein